MTRIIRFAIALILLPNAHAVPYRLAPCESRLLGRQFATAEAEAQNLVDVMMVLWPRSRAIFDRLAATYRRDWQRIGIPDVMGESVLGHTFNVVHAVRDWARHDPSIDVRRAVWMAMTHDFPKYLVPDFTPHDGISVEEKFQREHHAMNEIVEWLGEDARTFEELWLDFERGESREARLVRQIDALDIVPSACAYETLGFDVSNFFERTEVRLFEPRLLGIYWDLIDLRGKDFIDFREHYSRIMARPDERSRARPSSR